MQLSTLMSIKTGLYPEDCKYCLQNAKYNKDIKSEKLVDIKKIIKNAKQAKNQDQLDFVWVLFVKSVNDRYISFLIKVISEVKFIGLESLYDTRIINNNTSK